MSIKCLECGVECEGLLWSHFRYKCSGKIASIQEYKEKYPGAETKSAEFRKSAAVTLKNMINKYGVIEGKKKWDAYCEKQRFSNSFEYKRDKHGWTKEQFDEYNKSRAVTIENVIKRHGEEEGLKVWDRYIEAQRYTNTLEYFIEKYGDEGKNKWLNYNNLKGMASDPAYVSKKYNITFDEAVTKIGNYAQAFSCVSESEKNFINYFEKNLGENIKYTFKTKQFCIWSHDIGSILFYDLCDSKIKKIIEFNGDFWHCNPKNYDANFVNPISNITAKDCWERDQLKIKAANVRGFTVLTVWESDFISNSTKTIEDAIKWWKS